MASTVTEMLRRRFGGKSKPYDAEIEYLQSGGSQYIDTNIVPNADTGIMVEITKVNLQDTYFCGLRENSSNTRWCIGNPGYYGYGGYGGFTSVAIGVRFESYLNFENDKKYRVPINSYEVALPTLSFTPTSNIRLFGSAGAVASYSKWAGIIYSAKISQGANVIMDLIPVRVGTTGYMYDKVSGQLFGNAGTGDFILGNDK